MHKALSRFIDRSFQRPLQQQRALPVYILIFKNTLLAWIPRSTAKGGFILNSVDVFLYLFAGNLFQCNQVTAVRPVL